MEIVEDIKWVKTELCFKVDTGIWVPFKPNYQYFISQYGAVGYGKNEKLMKFVDNAFWREIQEPKYKPFDSKTIIPYLDWYIYCDGAFEIIYQFDQNIVNDVSYSDLFKYYKITKDFINFQPAGVLENE